jgi:kinesin family protein 5
MQSPNRVLSTYLSDEEGNDTNFMLRCSQRAKLRRKASRCVATSTGDNAGSTKATLLPDTSKSTGGVPDADAAAELSRVAPGEIDSDWPEDVSPTSLSPPGKGFLRPKKFVLQSVGPSDSLQKRVSENLQKRASSASAVTRSSPASTLTRKSSTLPLNNVKNNNSTAANIHVACRFRPLISREVKAGDSECSVNFLNDTCEENGARSASVDFGGKMFTLDRVFPPSALQSEVYNVVARPIVQDVLEGYNGTVMAYGSTGSGKTYTMEGKVGDPEFLGIIPRMVSTLFDGIDQAADTMEFTLKLSAVEIYMERIIDLLRQQGPDSVEAASTNVKVREDPLRGVWVDAVERHATNEADVFAVAHAAQASRRVAATHMNVRSSRSHYILMLRLTALDKQTLVERQGVLYLVDLAGSEQVSATGATGQTLEEAKKINRSLSCLGNVIVALTEEKERQHVPYRDSKLTRVLQQSLGGNAKTALIATCSLATSCLDETMTTLRFGERVKAVRNTPKVNEQRSMDQLVRELDDSTRTIEALKRDLASLQNNMAPASPTRSIGTSTSHMKLAWSANKQEVDDLSRDSVERMQEDDVLSDLLAPGARKALLQMQREMNVIKRERDAAFEQLSQLRAKGVQVKRLSPGEETDGEKITAKVAKAGDGGKAMRMIEAECAALKHQVASLVEARAAREEEERKLKEEVLQLRDASVRSSQELDFLRREREELRQMLQTCCTGDLQEERRQWNDVLSKEVARREATCEQWRAYLSNRVHKIVQLEIEVGFLRDALTSLQLSPHQHGIDITTLPGTPCQLEFSAEGDEAESLLQRLQHSFAEDSTKAAHHANVAQPIVRRRQRSRERQLPKSPGDRQFSATSSPHAVPECFHKLEDPVERRGDDGGCAGGVL